MRIWVKLWKDNHMMKDVVVVRDEDDTRTHKIFHALEESCNQLDLAVPVWLDSNIKEFKHHKDTKFRQDSFVEEIEFDYMEFMILDE